LMRFSIRSNVPGHRFSTPQSSHRARAGENKQVALFLSIR
jgi:hypothetical protein